MLWNWLVISRHFVNYSSPIVFAVIESASISVVLFTMMLTILIGGLFSLWITITSFLAELAILPELVMSLLIFRVMIVHEDVLWPVMGLC